MFKKVEGYGAPAAAATIVVAVVLANLLMTKPVSTLFRPVFEPRLTWLFRELPKPAPAPVQQPTADSPTPR